MGFWYGWDTPLIILNLFLWLILMMVNPRKGKWGLLVLIWAGSLGAALLTWFDYSFYAEAPRIPVHMLLLVLPVVLATLVLALESGVRIQKKTWSQTVLQWGFVLLLVDLVFYLFPYGYVGTIDYAVLGGSLLISLVLLSIKNVVYNREPISLVNEAEENFEGSENSESLFDFKRFEDDEESFELTNGTQRIEGIDYSINTGDASLTDIKDVDGIKDSKDIKDSQDTRESKNRKDTKGIRGIRDVKGARTTGAKNIGRSFVSFLLTIVLVIGSVALYGTGAVLTNANFSPKQPPADSDRFPVEAGYVVNEGATLYYEVRGEGQPLLLIPGGGGDAGFYTHVVDRLADTYQVITYDRRGNSRSKWEAPHNVEISQQASDAAAILQTVKAENAHVFGNSSGAIVAMELAAQYPQRLDTVIVHEPPVIRVLPDSSKWTTFFAGIHSTSARLGSEFGNTQFTFSVGVPLSTFSDVPDDFQERNALNTDILIQEEMPVFVQYEPNIQKLKRNQVNFIFAAGELSLHKQKYFARTAEVLSHEWNQELVLFPGHHLSYFDEAEKWANALKAALE